LQLHKDFSNTKDTLIEFAKLLSGAPKIALKKDMSLFKARSCANETEIEEIEKNPSNNLLANPSPAGEDGRFHSKGEYALYLSSSSETAIAEVKNENTKWVLIGEFYTCWPKEVFSLLPEDYNLNFFPTDSPVHSLSLFLNKIAHEKNSYSETNKFVDALKEGGFIPDTEKAVFIIRYQSVKKPPGENYFMCGAIENSKLLGLKKVESWTPTDYGFLKFVEHKKVLIAS
jgi:hypothetical protein